MAARLTLDHLRRHAVRGSLSRPATLRSAVEALGFVQADPIRSPARAQDLILRHRVSGYRLGDLERRFHRIGLEEDFLYAYGFMPRGVSRLLHPRHDPDGVDGVHQPTGMAANVLAFVRERGTTHPADLAAQFGKERAINGWGGFSKATTRALQALHYYGYLRVAQRRDGIRVYEAATPHAAPLQHAERLRQLVLLVVGILAPLPEASLAGTFNLLSRGAPGLGGWRATLQSMLASGELERGEADGQGYVWPTVRRPQRRDREPALRLLAPFDPIVWDRRRFELLWGWAYRFEAYTPFAKRQLGYYAMPLLWRDEVIGWANVSFAEGRLSADLGFANTRPRDAAFRRALDEELARMENFLATDRN